MIPDHVISEINRRLDIVDLVGEYVQLERKGNRFWGLSPFKQEKTPSFSVDPDKQLYYCFSTQQGGTAIHFFMQMEGLSFPVAVKQLAERLGIQFDQQEESEQDKQRNALFDLYARVTNTFSYFYHNSDQAAQAREYMLGRGFSAQILQEFEIGYCPDDPFWLHSFLLSKGYSRDLLAISGLFTKKNTERSLFTGRVLFPIRDEAGRVVAFGGRVLRGDGPKYINSPETAIYSKSRILYAFWRARQHIRSRKFFLVVEGYMDVIAMHQAGYQNTIAPLGTAFTAEQIKLLSRFAREAVLLFDGDEAGYKAAYKAAILCEQSSITAKAVVLPEKVDPADLLQGGGLHTLQNSVSSPLHVLEYLYSHISSRFNSSSVEGAASVIRELGPYLSSISSAVQREASFAYLGEKLGIDSQAVKSDVAGIQESLFRKSRQRKNSAENKENNQSNNWNESQLSIEMFLMLSAVAKVEFFEYIRRNVEIDTLQDDAARELYIALEDSFRQNQLTTAVVVDRLKDEDLRKVVIKNIHGNEYDFSDMGPIKEAVHRIQERNVRLRKQYLQRELNAVRGEDKESIDQQREIMAEIIHLDTILKAVRESADEGNVE